MAYAQATITSADAANDLVTVIQGLLTDAGWTLEDTFTPSGTFRVQVWKSDGSLNQAGYDWYLTIKWNTVGTEQNVEIIGGAYYNSAGPTFGMVPARAGASGSGISSNVNYSEPDGDMWGKFSINSATGTTKTGAPPHGGQGATIRPWFCDIVPSSAFAYWCSVTLDHFGIFTTINSSAYYIVGTLDVNPDYVNLGYVASNPLYSLNQSLIWQDGIHGVSATVFGTGTTSADYRNPVTSHSGSWGVALPSITCEYLDAYAWRPAVYLSGLGGNGGSPAFDGPSFSDRILIGEAIDFYEVRAGSIGDTVTIDGGTYVISGPSSPSNRSFALLVE